MPCNGDCIDGLAEFCHVAPPDRVFYGQASMNNRATGLELNTSTNVVDVWVRGDIISHVPCISSRFLVDRTAALFAARAASHVASQRLTITSRNFDNDPDLRRVKISAAYVITELQRAERTCKRRGSSCPRCTAPQNLVTHVMSMVYSHYRYRTQGAYQRQLVFVGYVSKHAPGNTIT